MTPGSSLIAALKNVAAIAFCNGQDPEDSPSQLEPSLPGFQTSWLGFSTKNTLRSRICGFISK
jgi:hypothetical protein